MSAVKVAKVSEVPVGQIRQFQVEDKIVAVYHIGDEFFATDELCTHRAGPLSEGSLSQFEITCPWHQAKFDVKTGKCLGGPGKRDLKTYRVEIKNDEIWVEK